jgi:hypothetical protein
MMTAPNAPASFALTVNRIGKIPSISIENQFRVRDDDEFVPSSGGRGDAFRPSADADRRREKPATSISSPLGQGS